MEKKYCTFLFLLLFSIYYFSFGLSTSLSQPKNKKVTTSDSLNQRPVVTDTVKSEVKQGGSVKIKIEEVLNENSNKNEGNLGDNILLKVSNIQDLLTESKIKGKPIVLYIDGLLINNSSGRIIRDTSANVWLKFPLKMKGAEESWLEILKRPDLVSRSTNLVTISAGIEGEKELESNRENFSLIIYNEMAYFQFIGISILLLLITIYLAVKTDMLREPVTDNSSKNKRPYSLALTQMAFWSYLVISTYLALYIITKEFPSITNSVLALMGISSATALGSVMINFKKIRLSKEKIISMTSEMRSIDNRVSLINELMKEDITPMRKEEFRSELESLNKRQYEIHDLLKEEKISHEYCCKGFLNDILSDSGGVSLYRFQIAVWTLVLGYIFIFTVWNSLKMPEFDNTLLALMGISSGTYLGFKIPEQRQ